MLKSGFCNAYISKQCISILGMFFSKVKSSNHDDLHCFFFKFRFYFFFKWFTFHTCTFHKRFCWVLLNVPLTPNFQPSCRWPKTLIPNYRLASELLTKRKSRIWKKSYCKGTQRSCFDLSEWNSLSGSGVTLYPRSR